MGREYVAMEITGRLSRHNDPRDRDDDRSWEELAAQVHRLVAQPRYRQIDANVEGGPDVTPDPDQNADLAGAVADVTAAMHRLSELARAEPDMGRMVAALGLLTGVSGPLAELMDFFGSAGSWLLDFEHQDADYTADRLRDAAGDVDRLRADLNSLLGFIRPLAD